MCTAWTRISDAQAPLATLGQAALDGDPNTMAYAAIGAGLLGDQATRAMEGHGEEWQPGVTFAGELNAAGFALVDIGMALAQADPTDPAPVRTALGSVLTADAAWAAARDDLALLRAATGFDCAGVAVPSPEPFPQPSYAPATPEPSFTGDTELESRFPKEIAGQPVQPALPHGRGAAGDPGPDRRPGGGSAEGDAGLRWPRADTPSTT